MPTTLTCPELKIQYDIAFSACDKLLDILKNDIVFNIDIKKTQQPITEVNEACMNMVKSFVREDIQVKLLNRLYSDTVHISFEKHQISYFDGTWCFVFVSYQAGQAVNFLYNPLTAEKREFDSVYRHDKSGFWHVKLDGKQFFYNPVSGEQLEQSFDAIGISDANGFWNIELNDKDFFYNPSTGEL